MVIPDCTSQRRFHGSSRLRSIASTRPTAYLKSETGHGTQKPVECMRRPIENNSSRGQVVYDPFCGSGTTIIAAEQTGRACHAIEIAPAYVDVAVKRWQALTGLEAKLDGDGRSFEEIALERAAQDRRPEPASRVWGPG